MAKLYNTVVEAIALRALCSRDPKIYGQFFAQVREDHFYNEEAQEAFRAIVKHFSNKGSQPSFKLLQEDLSLSEGTRDFLKSGDIALVKTKAQADQVLGQLDGYRKTRELFVLASGILKTLEKPKVNLDSLVSKVADRLTRVQTRRTTEESFFHLGKDSNAMALVEQILYEDGVDECIPTGFKTWDEHNGGLFRGSLVILAGNSGSGKSLLGNQMGINQALLGYKISNTPLEMTAKEQFARTMSNRSGLSSIDIFLQKLATGERDLVYRKMRRFDRAIAEKNGRYTIFKPPEDMTIEEILAALHSQSSDIIYVDYVTLLKGADGEDQWRKLGQIARVCKVYAENHNKIVVLLAQLSDEGRIRYSQTIKEHASVAWTWVATKDSRDRGYLNIDVMKSRNQIMRPFTLRIDYSTMTVSDLSPDELKTLDEENRRKDRQRASKEPRENFKPARKSSQDSEYLPDLSE